jgi:hypothetical protein
MKKAVTICIGTIGGPTFKRCERLVRDIASTNAAVDRVVVIRDKRPQSAWLNHMRLECAHTKWCLQVDEDMYLKKYALNWIPKALERPSLAGIRV